MSPILSIVLVWVIHTKALSLFRVSFISMSNSFLKVQQDRQVYILLEVHTLFSILKHGSVLTSVDIVSVFLPVRSTWNRKCLVLDDHRISWSTQDSCWLLFYCQVRLDLHFVTDSKCIDDFIWFLSEIFSWQTVRNVTFIAWGMSSL